MTSILPFFQTLQYQWDHLHHHQQCQTSLWYPDQWRAPADSSWWSWTLDNSVSHHWSFFDLSHCWSLGWHLRETFLIQLYTFECFEDGFDECFIILFSSEFLWDDKTEIFETNVAINLMSTPKLNNLKYYFTRHRQKYLQFSATSHSVGFSPSILMAFIRF